jgi:hypothetical protein
MKHKNQDGFVTTIIVIIIALFLLKLLFNFNILDFLKTPKAQEALLYTQHVILLVWHNFLEKPVMYVWNLILSLIIYLQHK